MNNYNFRFQPFTLLPKVIKNLLIINGLLFFGSNVLQNININLVESFGLYLPQSPYFSSFQLMTHMFMHSNFFHIFMNMFMLWMFGNSLENIWGSRKFLIYYIATGLGAAILHYLANIIQVSYLISQVGDYTDMNIDKIIKEGSVYIRNGQNYIDPTLAKINMIINTPAIGASGAVYGILMAFGMTYPDTRIYLYFAIPIKAKYFVIGLGALELISGLSGANSNIANFAHLGGMIFGYILIKYWQRRY